MRTLLPHGRSMEAVHRSELVCIDVNGREMHAQLSSRLNPFHFTNQRRRYCPNITQPPPPHPTMRFKFSNTRHLDPTNRALHTDTDTQISYHNVNPSSYIFSNITVRSRPYSPQPLHQYGNGQVRCDLVCGSILTLVTKRGGKITNGSGSS